MGWKSPGLDAIDRRLAELTVPYEEWEVLYRQRLQVERDLLRTGQVPAAQGDVEEEPGPVGRLARAVKELIR